MIRGENLPHHCSDQGKGREAQDQDLPALPVRRRRICHLKTKEGAGKKGANSRRDYVPECLTEEEEYFEWWEWYD
jgi:hypothetical protein